LKLILLLILTLTASTVTATDRWLAPFDSSGIESIAAGSILTLDDIVKLVAAKSPVLKSLDQYSDAAQGMVKQAGMWSNPELETEIGDIGGDAPGLSEPEITVSLSREFELFGQRSARQSFAQAGVDAAELEARLSAFDLYLEVKSRFYQLSHAQERFRLTEKSVDLAESTLENIEFKLRQGAAMQSEMLLAQLEVQRMQLARAEARQELDVAQISLVSLWNGDYFGFSLITPSEPDFKSSTERLLVSLEQTDSTREILTLAQQRDMLRAEQELVKAEARPAITLSGGFRRIEADGSNSFLIGIGLPLPLWNRNQGVSESLQAQMRLLDYQAEQADIEARAEIRSGVTRLRQLIEQHDILDSSLVPTGEEAYQFLQEAYQAGRIPYTSLLEAERTLNELRFEHNDMLLSLYEQIIALERTTGVQVHLTAN